MPLVLLKIDIARAFDTVRHDVIYDMLEAKGVPLVWRCFFAKTYHSMYMDVSLFSAFAEKVPMKMGVRQGSRESALMFAAVLDFVLGPTLETWTQQKIGVQLDGTFIHHVSITLLLLMISLSALLL